MPAKIIPFTREQILDRITRGPATFAELARAKKADSPARATARVICDELSAQGVIIQPWIGRTRYYILNTPEAKRQAVIQQIEESCRHDAISGCTIWLEDVDPVRGPIFRQNAISPDNVAVNARRWLFSDLIGRELDGMREVVKMLPTCEPNCVDPKHMVLKSRSQILKGIPKSMAARLQMHKRMVQKWGKPENAAEIIRASDKSDAELAAELGMCKGNVWAIRSGKTHALQAATPFTGLGAR